MPLILVRNDITKMKVDAIVNAASQSLLGGGGVDGSIHRAAGAQLLEECRSLGGCPTGEARLTKAYRLPCRYVIHTVGPVWEGGSRGEEALLAGCYTQSLTLAREQGCESVAFPLISSGVFGYPKELALQVATEAIRAFLAQHDMTVYLVVFDRAAYQIGSRRFADITAYIDDHYVQTHSDLSPRRRQRAGSALQTAQRCAPAPCAPLPQEDDCLGSGSLDELITQLDAGFSETLLRLIDRSGKKDSEIYKKANVDRKLFSKIRTNPQYKPSKPTALAFAIALELDLEQTKDLIGRAGFALSRSYKFDVIIEYFIRQGIYDVFQINEALFAFDESLLGA